MRFDRNSDIALRFMITVAVVNRKGGPGKTTVAILAAIGLHENGARVGAIDADHEQGSLTNSLFGSEIEVNPSNLEALDFLVVDTAPFQRQTGPGRKAGRYHCFGHHSVSA